MNAAALFELCAGIYLQVVFVLRARVEVTDDPCLRAHYIGETVTYQSDVYAMRELAGQARRCESFDASYDMLLHALEAFDYAQSVMKVTVSADLAIYEQSLEDEDEDAGPHEWYASGTHEDADDTGRIVNEERAREERHLNYLETRFDSYD